jgi:hypothetical protein
MGVVDSTHSTGGEIILNRDSRLLNCRRRVARTLLIIAIVFAVCWMPYNLTQLFLDTLEKEQLTEMDKTAPHLLMVSTTMKSTREENRIFLNNCNYDSIGAFFQSMAGPCQLRNQSSSLLPLVTQHSSVSCESLSPNRPESSQQFRTRGNVETPMSRH